MSRQVGVIRLKVVAGILVDRAGNVLLAERTDDGPFRGLWEFPGGKIDEGESSQDALGRELAEEIGVELLESAHFLSVDHDYDDRCVSIEFYLVSKWRYSPAGQEGQQLNWVHTDELNAKEMLPADLSVVETLQRRRG